MASVYIFNIIINKLYYKYKSYLVILYYFNLWFSYLFKDKR